MGSESATGIIGARLADGRQVFVADSPRDLRVGIRIALWWDDSEQIGVVSIPPQLLVWRDAEAPVGRFLAVLGSAAPEATQADQPPPLALFVAEDGIPGPNGLTEMLALARAETDRLDG